jgi:O-antigen/teichoic acid export membrane protein
MAPDIAQKIIKNTVVIFFARVWFLALSIVLTPYVLHRLGAVEYGIWVLIGAVVGYLGLVDLGFGTSFVKHVAEYHARDDAAGVSGVLSAGLAFYAAVAGIILLIASFGLGWILDLLTVPRGLEGTVRIALELGIVASLCANFIELYQSITNGLQRMDVSNAIAVFMSVGYAIGCVIVLELGFGLVGLAAAQLVIQVLGVVASVCLAHRLYPGLRFRWDAIRRHGSVLFRYGLNLQLSNVARLINAHFDKLVVNRYVDVAHVAYYDIGSRPLVMARSFPLLLLTPLTPATSELEVRSGTEKLYEMFSTVSKYVAAVAFPLFAGITITSPLIIETWVGPGYDAAATVTRVLCLGYLAAIIAGPVSPLVQGIGRPQYQRNAETLSLILNVTLSLLLIRRYGFFGAPVGTAIALSVASGYYLWSFHRLMKRPLLSFLAGAYLGPALWTLLSGFLGWTVVWALAPHRTAGRVGPFLVVVAAAIVMGASYLVLLFRSRYFDDRELALLKRYVHFSRRRT